MFTIEWVENGRETVTAEDFDELLWLGGEFVQLLGSDKRRNQVLRRLDDELGQCDLLDVSVWVEFRVFCGDPLDHLGQWDHADKCERPRRNGFGDEGPVENDTDDAVRCTCRLCHGRQRSQRKAEQDDAVGAVFRSALKVLQRRVGIRQERAEAGGAGAFAETLIVIEHDVVAEVVQNRVIGKQRAAIEHGPLVDQHGRGRVIGRDEPAVDGVAGGRVDLDRLVSQAGR